MNDSQMTYDLEWAAMAREVRGSPLPEARKLAHAFGRVTGRIIGHAEREVEAARAIFEKCYLLATGRKAWDE